MYRQERRLMLLGCLLLVLVGCSATIINRQEYYASKQLKQQWTEVRNSTGSFVRQGECRGWYENGQLMETCEYVDGQLHGQILSYYPHLIKRSEGQYLNGKRQGIWTSWYAGGQEQERSEYSNDLLHGEYCKWRDNGLRWVEGSYKNGRKDGFWTSWDELGMIASYEQYADGKLLAANNAR